MEVLDAFNSDAFQFTSLVDSINHQDHKPNRLGNLGIFEVEPLATDQVAVEEDNGTLALVPVAGRGGVGEPVERDRRVSRPFVVPHLPTRTQVMAAEVQNVRAFGQANRASAEMMAVEQVRDRKLAKARSRLEATVEYHRIGAVKGVIFDANGSTTLLNLFTAFNVAQSTFGFDLDNQLAKVTQKIRQAQRMSLDVLKEMSNGVSGWLAICGDTFFDELIGHPKLEQLYLNHEAAASLREGVAPYSTFPFGGVSWENYRGTVGAVGFIDASKAYLIPMGVPGLFKHYLAPADYMETVNTMALPFYAKSEMLKFNKGIDIEVQTNPLLLCTRPNVVIELDMSGS